MSSAISAQAGSSSSVPADRTGAGPGGAEPTEEERTAAAAVLRMIWGMHISRAIYAVTELGIPDRLADGPVSCAELARDAGAQITAEPHDTDYGSRDFAARDPEGTRWSFGTYRGEPRKG